MEEKKLNVIDLFSGAGGFSAGFKKAGFQIVLANEIHPQIAETYKVNHEGTIMVNMDIKNFAENTDAVINQQISMIEDETKKADLINKLNNIDVIIGGPPCQGFSMAGSRIRLKNAFIEDPRNYLFKYYFNIIQKFEPKYFIMENVNSLLSAQNGKIIEEIERLFQNDNNFKRGGYHLCRAVLNSADFGVPQSRRRLIIIGSKYEKIDLEKELENVKRIMSQSDENRFASVSIQDAISDLNYLDHGQGSFEDYYENQPITYYQKQRRINSEKLYNHIATKHKDSTLERIMRVEPGQNWQDLEERDEIKSVHSGSYGRMVWDEIAVTITTRFDTPSGGRFIHPELHRALTPREAARIQSFDDDFIFLGNKTSIQTQIGNAVPPLLAEVLANVILEDIKKRG